MALDPCVTEEFLKHYVAYKAETNFVDVIAQAKRLILLLNLPFHELEDPKRMAKDVTNISHWGNGDVDVRFHSLDELPYIMGLVRQAFEKQMGHGNVDR
jgi:predicted transport protein